MSALFDTAVQITREKIAEIKNAPVIAIDGNVFTAVQERCRASIRQEFDRSKDMYERLDLIAEAQALGLSDEFIAELRADFNTGK